MKTFIILIAAILLFVQAIPSGEIDVYLCKGKGSKRYHYIENCRDLSRCSTKVYKVTLKKAKEMRRTLCGWED